MNHDSHCDRIHSSPAVNHCFEDDRGQPVTWKEYSAEQIYWFNSLPHNPDFYEKKAFENIVGKAENAGHQHFLLFPQCFLLFPTQISIFESDIFVVWKCFN